LKEVLQAVSISQPVMATLEREGFAGSVLSAFAGACNLVSDQGDVVALVSQRVGNGPLNIVLEGDGFLARGLEAGLPVEGDGRGIQVGEALVSLAGAKVWDPRRGGGMQRGVYLSKSSVEGNRKASGRAAGGGLSRYRGRCCGSGGPGARAHPGRRRFSSGFDGWPSNVAAMPGGRGAVR
jgi:hypothetical protein